MPIHLRAERGRLRAGGAAAGRPAAGPADRARLPGRRQAGERRARACSGFTGTFEGKPVSVQSTGMGCPSAAIVIEELITARRAAADPRRHLRRAAAAARARRPGRGALGRAGRLAPRFATPAASPTPRRPTSTSPTASSTPPRSSAAAAGRPDRELRHVLRPRPRPPQALGGAGRAGGRDGGRRAVHDRRAARDPGGLRADGVRHRLRRGVHAHLRRRAGRGGRADDAASRCAPRWTSDRHPCAR